MSSFEKNQAILMDLVSQLDLPDSAYKRAKKRYEDLGEWLARPDSLLASAGVHIFPQGSFRLGTAIHPVQKGDEYDLDLCCKLTEGLSKSNISQFYLKKLLQVELNAYREARGIRSKIEEKRRCWRMEYRDELCFHMDIVPGIPESEENVSELALLLEDEILPFQKTAGTKTAARAIANTAVAITDNKRENYHRIDEDWNVSNPEGYASWFDEQKVVSSLKKTTQGRFLLEAQIDPLPTSERGTPLQQAIQLLKQHRDIMFKEHPDAKPISIIITTLAARAYDGEGSLKEALWNIINGMGTLVSDPGEAVRRIPNPVDPREDFSDKWSEPEYAFLNLEKNFWSWLAQAQADFGRILKAENLSEIEKVASEKMDITLSESVRSLFPEEPARAFFSPRVQYNIPSNPQKPHMLQKGF